MNLTDHTGHGFRFTGEPTIDITARRWTSEDLEAAKHTTDLVPRDHVFVNLDLARVNYWLDVGAQPSDTVRSLLRRAGVLKARHETRLGRKLQASAVALPENAADESAAEPAAEPAPESAAE